MMEASLSNNFSPFSLSPAVLRISHSLELEQYIPSFHFFPSSFRVFHRSSSSLSSRNPLPFLSEAHSREQTQIVQKIASQHNGSDFVFAEEPDEKKELWKIRKEALWACFAMEPNSEAMITDVCVPLSHLAELISRSKQELDTSPLTCTVIAHAGDGNFHTIVLFDPSKKEQRREAERLNHFMVHTALSMEGTCTGEHGVGTGKMKYLEKELGMENLRTMKKIKVALDPNNIMNPGKLIPPHVCF